MFYAGVSRGVVVEGGGGGEAAQVVADVVDDGEGRRQVDGHGEVGSISGASVDGSRRLTQHLGGLTGHQRRHRPTAQVDHRLTHAFFHEAPARLTSIYCGKSANPQHVNNKKAQLTQRERATAVHV